ncbi:hypothetical protein HCN44_003176 [Aphidius gifuensis]|uniref:Xyloside xylosyltransferase 1 n=1 Tax=Aphidius gifuensis TaxID=684658 RepID=A0A834XL91_APHGI|nr:xyloside xylosyltransferase 1 [Aphidius gifuensis]KAF7987414.1 hypothetical protein HCN44_003176 [Aphidius gifuensis]
MRLSKSYIIKLIILTLLLIIIYCLQTSQYWNKNNILNKNDNIMENHSASLIRNSLMNNNNNNNINNKTTIINNENKNINKNNIYNVWCIFTKLTSTSPMRRKFRIFTESLLKYSSVNLTFNVIIDNSSRKIAETIINTHIIVFKKFVKINYYDVHKLSNKIQDIVEVMSPKFSSNPGTYYSDALFFLSLGLHRIASVNDKYGIMLDVDTKLSTDIKLLFDEFNNFGDDSLFGLAPELTPVYRHILYLYRSKNSATLFGEPYSSGGYPGYNSGVVLFHLERLRNSLEYDQIVSEDMVHHMTEKYSFRGHLGDQDFYTLLGMERPELIHNIDCTWNRQLCTWWRDRGYSDVFGNYSSCNGKIKIWHGNCNTPIPDD